MKSTSKTAGSFSLASSLLVAGLLVLAEDAAGQTNNVTAGTGIDYVINGQNDPPFTLQRGVT